jgi:glutathione S-transferase
VQSAIDRYANEVRRVLGVLDGVLKDREWLVGDKMTYADLSFVAYNNLVHWLMKHGESPIDEFPHVKAWHERMTSRPTFQKINKTISDQLAATAAKSTEGKR